MGELGKSHVMIPWKRIGQYFSLMVLFYFPIYCTCALLETRSVLIITGDALGIQWPLITDPTPPGHFLPLDQSPPALIKTKHAPQPMARSPATMWTPINICLHNDIPISYQHKQFRKITSAWHMVTIPGDAWSRFWFIKLTRLSTLCFNPWTTVTVVLWVTVVLYNTDKCCMDEGKKKKKK